MNKSEELEVRWLGRISFDEALRLQEDIVAALRKAESRPQFLLLEHDPVYTIGRTRDQSSLRDASLLPHPVREINRGGQATYHGPGQLVGYLLLDLHDFGRDLHRYLRFLENELIAVIGQWNIKGRQSEGLTGVWVDDRKIASIGVGVRHWITMHGFALNVSAGIDGFASITPCGIANVRMTSVSEEAGAEVTVREVAEAVENRFKSDLPDLAR